MERLFAAVVRPLLDALEPVAVRYAGREVPEVLWRWSGQSGVPVRTATDVPADLLVAAGDGDLVAAIAAEPYRLVVVHDAEQGLVGTPDRRLEGLASTVVAAAGADMVSAVIPGAGGLVVVAPPATVEALGEQWTALIVGGTARAVIRAIEAETSGAGLEGDITAARRLIERQDRELAELRSQRRREDILQRRVELLEERLERLQSRRSVRTVLKVAEVAKPMFQLRRGQITWRELFGVSDRVRRHGDDAQPLRTHHDFAASDTGRFYDLVRPLVDGGAPKFVDAWSRSEDAVRDTPPWPGHVEPPLVSIVMPTYNRADLIVEAIDTVTDQQYTNWELLVSDDGSDDDTEAVVAAIGDDRIRYERVPHGGAAAARNAALARARGDLIAYLDTDNVWHPRFLDQAVRAMLANPGRHAVYTNYLDLVIDGDRMRIKGFRDRPFDYERLTQKNFVDLNGFVHRRVLYDRYGGFDTDLVRQQDWDLILKYTFLRNPLYLDRHLVLYRRNPSWEQITDIHRDDPTTQPIIDAAVAGYYRNGLPTSADAHSSVRLTVVAWDICRNHFSKAYNIAEAVADRDSRRVELLGFRFFDDPIFPPYAHADPTFRTSFRDGANFPTFDDALARTVADVHGGVVYAVKPRLPSLGVALLANYHFGTPVVLECNDLESVVTSPEVGQQAAALDIADVDPADPDLRDPYGLLWTAIMEGLASRVPLRATHNRVLDDHFGGGAFYVRNPKDEAWFDPDRYDRDQVRGSLGIDPDDRVLLFGGMVRRHKGIFHFAELLERVGPEWRLLVVGSRETPDQRRLRDRVGDRLTIVPPVDRNEMAKVNLAADAVVLWLDPEVPASHFQMPFKLTDALAMRVPVIANPIGDLADLGHAGYLRLAAFGDHDALAVELDKLLIDRTATRGMVDAGRRLYLRQFSYRATRETMDLLLDRAVAEPGVLDVAAEFAEFFARFRAAQPAGRTLLHTGDT